MRFRLIPCWMLAVVVSLSSVVTYGAPTTNNAAAQTAAQQALQKKLDEAIENSVVDFQHAEFVTINKPLRVTKPLWIRGLRLQLPPKLPRTQLVIVDTPGIRITDSFFRGNGDTVGQDQRASLVDIHAGNFSVERCVFENSSKNGLTIDPQGSGKPLVGGVIRDIVGRNVTRDVVSLSGGPNGAIVQDVLVENVRASDSKLRGAVEVSDGSEDITVRSVWAERCVYAVDFQDHEDPTGINHNVLIEDIKARKCRHAVRTATDHRGHSGLTIRDVWAEDCDVPVRVSCVRDVIVDGVRVIGRERDTAEANDLECVVQVKDCENVVLRDVAIIDAGDIPAAVRVVDTTQLDVDGLAVSGDTKFDHALLYEFTSEATAEPIDNTNLRRIVAPGARQFAVGLSVAREQPEGLAKVQATTDK